MVLSSGPVVVVAATVLATIVTETVMYFWVYSTPSFRAVRDQLETFQQSQDPLVPGSKPKGKKRLEREEDRLRREVTREMGRLRLKQGVVLVGAVTVLYRSLMPIYSGTPVAQLPFEPFKLFQRVTHYGLDGPITDCSMTFVYTLCQMAIRPTVTMLMGLGPSRKMQELMQPATLGAMAEKDS
ncbi:hypothetical protein WJX84_007215 [Apatococcus fuscideae]|uniref:Calcium load-activated calcium channel n=1 Tax=Apatococcus fuscideae TaxID=2026836 RepID=A0AAW1T1L4_9CHLO